MEALPNVSHEKIANEIKKYENRNLIPDFKSGETDKTRKEQLSWMSILVYAIISTNFKILLQIMLGDSLQRYPHFQIQHTSLTSVKEAINHHSINGTHYYSDPNSVNQSIGVIKILELLLGITGERGFMVFLYVVDLMIIAVQFKLLDRIWMKKKFVQEYEVSVLMMFVFFNPMQMCGPCA